MTGSSVSSALESFMQRALEVQSNDYFVTPFDRDFRSQAELASSPDGDLSLWRPTPQAVPVDFGGLENALEFPIHPDIKAYYGTYWAGGIDATSMEGHVSLIQLWNPDDFDRLIANLIGHALAKQRAKDPFTVFFATTEPESEFFLSIDNESGEVMLEEPGKSPHKVVERRLDDFLNRLTPLDQPPGIF